MALLLFPIPAGAQEGDPEPTSSTTEPEPTTSTTEPEPTTSTTEPEPLPPVEELPGQLGLFEEPASVTKGDVIMAGLVVGIAAGAITGRAVLDR